MTLGKEIRLNRLLDQKSHRYLGVTVDHSMARGVMPGLENISSLIQEIFEGGPNGLTMHKGIAEKCVHKGFGNVPIVLKCTTFSPVNPKRDVPVASVKEAIALGADAISVGCIVLGKEQEIQVETLAKFTAEAKDYGMPVFAHLYPRGLDDSSKWRDVANVMYATRLGAELGVDLIKTMYTGSVDSFAKVVEATPAMVAVAGGDAGLNSVDECLKLAKDVIDAGGVGITFGRCIFQFKKPSALIKALSKVIHENYSVKEAHEYLDNLLH